MDTLTFEQFRRAVTTRSPRGATKVRNSWGVYDYYKYYRVHRPNEHKYVLEESAFFAIIRKVNKLIVEEICRTGFFQFPHRMGGIKILRKPIKAYFHNGVARSNRAVDWDKTLEFWYNNEEAYKNRDVIYRNDTEKVKAMYVRSIAIFKNKIWYNFSLCRTAMNAVRRAFNSGELKLEAILSNTEIKQIKGLYDEY